MPLAQCSLQVEANRMERQPVGRSLFPCHAYRGDVHQYIASQVPPHWHHEVELFMLDQGKVEVSAAETQFLLQPGQGVLVNTDKLHSMTCAVESPCRYRSLVFDPSIVAGPEGNAIAVKYVRPFLENGPPTLLLLPGEAWQKDVLDAFEAAHAACQDKAYAFEFTVREALSRAFLLLQQHAGEAAASPSPLREERLKQMLLWFDAHYSEPFSLRVLAQAVHFSPRECERTFEQLLHTTPQSYLQRRRILAAMDLLAHGELPVIEVAARCGFSSHSYFSKQFRAATGYTPRGYRAKTQGA